jgi:hypothetical protein
LFAGRDVAEENVDGGDAGAGLKREDAMILRNVG